MEIVYSKVTLDEMNNVRGKLFVDVPGTVREVCISFFRNVPFIGIFLIYIYFSCVYYDASKNVLIIILFWPIVWILYESYKLLMCKVFPFEYSCSKQNKINKKLYDDTGYTIDSIKNQDDLKDIYSIYNPEDITFILADNTLFVVKKENLHTLIKSIKLTEQEAYGLRERQILDFSYLDEVYQIICNQLENNIDNTGSE